ncbi:MAG: histidine kinase, partial [Oscillochloris sp.]|nr:histidine kinase [Oscillochloris sp.]
MPMRNTLTTWLSAHRLDLSAQWADLIGEPVQPFHGDHADDDGAVATISSPAVSIDQLYDLLMLAADGDYAALESRIHAISYSDDIRDQALNERLGRAFEFRRTFRALLRRKVSDSARSMEMIDDFDTLFEYVLSTL